VVLRINTVSSGWNTTVSERRTFGSYLGARLVKSLN